MPRPSRSTTWPRDLSLTEAEQVEEASAARREEAAPAGVDGEACRAVEHVTLPQAGPVWVRVAAPGEYMQPAEPGAAAAETVALSEALAGAEASDGNGQEGTLPAPSTLRQHFFLHSAGEVGDRLRSEHGIGGTWAADEVSATNARPSRRAR